MEFGIAETGIARGSPPGTTTEVLRFGVPFAEIRVVSGGFIGDLEVEGRSVRRYDASSLVLTRIRASGLTFQQPKSSRTTNVLLHLSIY
jgi:hypothetical protein